MSQLLRSIRVRRTFDDAVTFKGSRQSAVTVGYQGLAVVGRVLGDGKGIIYDRGGIAPDWLYLASGYFTGSPIRL